MAETVDTLLIEIKAETKKLKEGMSLQQLIMEIVKSPYFYEDENDQI